MNIRIFEDQTGLMLFPKKSSDKDANIVRLFDNKIDLYVKKTGDNLEINCYVLARKGQERAIGCYIICEDKFTDGIFSNFKKGANDSLRSIGFVPQSDNTENVIFDNMEKFDSDGSQREDIETISKVLESNECLNYKAGNIDDIAVFCRRILSVIKTIKIAISTGKSNLGNINILRNKIYQERLAPADETKKILDIQKENIVQKLVDEKRRILEEKKRIDGDVGDNKIREGTILIKDGLRIKRDVGYSNSEIDDDIKRINNTIIEKPLSGKPDIDDTRQKDDVVSHTTYKKIVAILGITMLILGTFVGMFIYPTLSDDTKYKISKIVGKETPVPTIVSTPVQTIVSTPEQTVTITAESTATMTAESTATMTAESTATMTAESTIGDTKNNDTNDTRT